MSPRLTAEQAPYRQLRQTTLGYHGPSADLTNSAEIRIGWFGPTNVNDPLTGDLWWAARRAVEEVNSEHADLRLRQPGSASVGISGQPLPESWPWPCRLVARWAVDPWGTGVSQLTRMVYDEQPLALLGSIDSASTHLAEQVVAKANLPLVSPICTDKSVTLAGVSWMFSCAPSDSAIARVLVDSILRCESTECPAMAWVPVGRPTIEPAPVAGQRSRVAVLACTDHESRMTAREVLREFSQRGRMPDFRLDVPSGMSDLRPHLERLVERRPYIVVVIAGVEDSARLVRGLRGLSSTSLLSVLSAPRAASAAPGSGGEGAGEVRMGWRPILFGTHSAGHSRFRELAGDAGDDVRYPCLIASDVHRPDYALFVRAFESDRGRPPDYTALLTYDATRLLLRAIREVGPNRARIRDKLVQLSPWPGLGGAIHFDGTGQNQRTNVVLCSRDMQFDRNQQP